MATKLIGVKLSPEMHERVVRLAAQLNKSLSETARELIERGLEVPGTVVGNWAMHSLQRDIKEIKTACKKEAEAAAKSLYYAREAAIGARDIKAIHKKELKSAEISKLKQEAIKKLDAEAAHFAAEWMKK